MPSSEVSQAISFPEKGEDFTEITSALDSAAIPVIDWEAGRAFSFQYHPGETRNLVAHAYHQFSELNAMAPGLFPGVEQMERELIGMIEDLFRVNKKPAAVLTSGGTESIILSVRAARTKFRNSGRSGTPEMIVPLSAHPAFWKAADLMDFKLIPLPLDRFHRADLEVLKGLLNEQTAMIVASAPSYPFGMIDPIALMAGQAGRWDAWMHVDACIGGFLLPFMPESSKIPPWDFHLDDVQSISVDLHKYAFGGKALSALLYRNKADRRNAHFIRTDWPGGLFGATSLAGSRSAAPVAAAWAAIKQLGKSGYKELIEACCHAADEVKKGIDQIDELHILSDSPLPVLAFGSFDIDVYQLADEMLELGWFLDKQQLPPALHMNLQPVQPELIPEFLEDLNLAVRKVKSKERFRSAELGVERYFLRHLPTQLAEAFFHYESRRKGSKATSSDAYMLRNTLEDRKMLDDLLRDYLESRLEMDD